MSSVFPNDFVPRKSPFGARLIANHDTSLPAGLRRLLLLADGQRTVFTLGSMVPDRNVAADLHELMQRGLIEEAGQTPPASLAERINNMADPDLPDGWESASDFMVSRARESLGVTAIDVIDALEQANGPEAARAAMSQWYRAMRSSREGREQADLDRIKANAMLRGQSPS
ncbi:hypothetical protein [Uliginosibacterium sp. TH139]|uniref:hypothetical protein n=1 Tax=Uliginosibacterium sp. TH139 TaxID=2067453 RepID=UPI000C7CFF59|nr:hypothetical protein [Uliginosibacterium sp. TH139]PLK50503.1 hypothetical protein C0V76_01365 [Uliginosibacterium sp. TH139]